MKRVTILLCFLLAVTTAFAQPVQKRLDSLLDYYAQTLQFNGVAFVSVKGQTLLNRGYGYQDWEQQKKNTPNTIFQIGSITKQFTAEVILMLAREGKLNLQDRIGRYFPGYPSGDSITIEHLLTHTSGIYEYTDDTLWRDHPSEAVSHEQVIAIFRNRQLAFTPGSKFKYCNSNYILLTYIIEQVTGKPYTVVVRERILTPLGMRHSGFDFMHLASADKPVGYNCVLVDSFRKDRLIDSTLSLGAGGLYSTAQDLYKWHRALQSYRLLDKSWQEKAYQPFQEGYGYGWMTGKVAGKPVLAHSGGINGFLTYFLRIEEEDVCIVLLSNIYFPGANNKQIANDIVRCLYDSSFRVPAVRREVQLSDRLMQRYEGTYAMTIDTSIVLTIEVDRGRMLLRLAGQPEDRIYPQSETLFFARSADAQFEFVPDPRGGYKILLHQHGEQYEALRRM